MPLTHGILTHRYPHHTKLGRHQVLDARSLEWLHEHAGAVLKPASHTPRIPVLDQEDLFAQGIRVSQVVAGGKDVDALGSCTGNAGTAAVSLLLDDTEAKAAGLDLTGAKGAEEWAIGLYAEATALDDADGRFPPVDTGSSGLGIAKALKRRGLVGHYRHATTATAVASLLQTGPVLLGVPWFRDWFEPDRHGFVDGGDWASSPLAGGHEICVIALEQVVQDHAGRIEPGSTVIRFRNSWSRSWGDDGDGLMTLATYQALRRYIDAIQLRK
ncbi:MULTISPECIES: hypothetical protein [unclassified Streptomyces]|uniref:hypothetical protein n=1 Tax=unclassified Streptomyces TaxID=2593676 RepID=UPI002E80EDA9|nr:hypothetical protein [Streptomyces sp. NBC_00589]WTI37433.1 hypothetical protein OIC96_21660 [Streptomyces sp. NBC_00775]WUB28890.1 hypothetical protein OHA51_28075 [Streptomyces sp. NBC_00589]